MKKHQLPMPVGDKAHSASPIFNDMAVNWTDRSEERSQCASQDIAGKSETVHRSQHLNIGERQNDTLVIAMEQLDRLVAGRSFEAPGAGLRVHVNQPVRTTTTACRDG